MQPIFKSRSLYMYNVAIPAYSLGINRRRYKIVTMKVVLVFPSPSMSADNSNHPVVPSFFLNNWLSDDTCTHFFNQASLVKEVRRVDLFVSLWASSCSFFFVPILTLSTLLILMPQSRRHLTVAIPLGFATCPLLCLPAF